ncbi:hypothetical protein [Anaerosacchariphilus polymeriproducens]|uniref:CopG family transcriptional regulator n=1 Tax=Anaerosacchariphilus polymeriproducens TaxID=1812858 RepID=A0A371AV29_9FIRM|nr:hypothetical protein [Anaerosacchariphilus polymeriproducens]RDU23399.1 hypothetical protein DWV06_10115 [Anaerosacchariphilus polymeriproducens]
MASLKDEIVKQEKKVTQPKKSPVTKLTSTRNKKKNFASASIQVEPVMYQRFKQINQMNGQSNNAVIRNLIAQYVRENKELLDQEF